MKFPRKDLDEIDYAILELLQDNGRLTLSELGRQIGLSPPAAAERMSRLSDLGVIAGYSAVINKEKLGLPFLSLIIADLVPPDRQRAFAAVVDGTPQITACYHIMGGGKEAVLNVYCRDHEQLIGIQTALSKITSITTLIVEPQASKKAPLRRELLRKRPAAGKAGKAGK